ncbi:MAG: hypothetical protein VX727_07270 [Planctomycetota bacterium]|nr:hypothetical protein [Planctomycetota bacterium]
MLRLTTTIVLSAALLGCDGKTTEQNAPSTESTTTQAPTGIPAETYLTERPADVLDLVEIKKNAKTGDAVVFLARVGGRVKPFAEKQAIFVAADPSLKSCELMSTEDYCTMPWDYCCTSREDLRMGTATIRILGADGRPVATSAQGAGGLEPLKFIVVEGTVSDRNDEGLFVVDADRIWVGGKPTYEEPRKGSI